MAMHTNQLPGLLILSSLLIGSFSFFGSTTAFADPVTAISDDGREVILNDNGEWQYVTEDRFATTEDGQRIRLKADQRWQKVRDSEAPAYQPVPISTIQRDSITISDSNLSGVPHSGNSFDVTLDQVQVENQRETVGKNKRLRSNLVFYLEIKGQGDSEHQLNPEQFSVQDSRGKAYPVFSVTAGTSPIGGKPRWVIRAKGAPRWWGVKFFSLQIAPNALGNTDSIELRKPMRDVLKKEVESLPEDGL